MHTAIQPSSGMNVHNLNQVERVNMYCNLRDLGHYAVVIMLLRNYVFHLVYLFVVETMLHC